MAMKMPMTMIRIIEVIAPSAVPTALVSRPTAPISWVDRSTGPPLGSSPRFSASPSNLLACCA